MVDLPLSVQDLFVSAGWKASGATTSSPCIAVEFARQLIAEFAGLRVGRAGSGRDLATSDIHFYSHLRPEVSVVGEPWLSGLGPLSGIATAHHDHIIVLVGSGGQCYAFTDESPMIC